jgi:CheY-like chemotaxis protein
LGTIGTGAGIEVFRGVEGGEGVRDVQVLLAEDNFGDVFLVRKALGKQRMNYVLRVLKDGLEAEAYLNLMGTAPESPCPDVFLVDLNLPRGDGHELLKKFRAHPECSAVPVVVVTSSDAPSDRELAQKAGANAYFRKPADLHQYMQLGELVEKMVQDARGERATPDGRGS